MMRESETLVCRLLQQYNQLDAAGVMCQPAEVIEDLQKLQALLRQEDTRRRTDPSDGIQRR